MTGTGEIEDMGEPHKVLPAYYRRFQSIRSVQTCKYSLEILVKAPWLKKWAGGCMIPIVRWIAGLYRRIADLIKLLPNDNCACRVLSSLCRPRRAFAATQDKFRRFRLTTPGRDAEQGRSGQKDVQGGPTRHPRRRAGLGVPANLPVRRARFAFFRLRQGSSAEAGN